MASQWYIRVAEGAAILAGAFAIYELGKYVASRTVKGAPVVLKAAIDAAGEVMPVESWHPSIAGHSTDYTRQATAAVRDTFVESWHPSIAGHSTDYTRQSDRSRA